MANDDRAVKVVDAQRGIIAGWGIPFGGPVAGKDLDGEFFDSETDFALDWFPNEGRPVLYDHGFDAGLKASVVGRQFGKKLDPELGLWVEAQLNMAHRYAEAIMELAQQGALGFSSGAMKHLIVKDEASGKVLRWPWVEESLTPMPANPYALISTEAVKHFDALALDLPEPLKRLLDELKTAVAVHHTATSEGAWDGPANEARLRKDGDAAYYTKAYAWRDPDEDGTAKAHWRFIHHEVAAGGGAVGAANMRACFTGIGILNGGRGGTTIPDGDRQGVWRHLGAHLKDGDRTAPELRSTSLFKFADHAEHVLADVQALLERSESLVELRAQEGRGLSEANVKRLAELREQLDRVLAAGQPDTAAMDSLRREFVRFQRTLADLPASPIG